MGMLRTDDSELLSRIATNEGHGENCSYFDGWKAYDSDPFHPVRNPNGVIQMGLAENQLCLDLIQDWLKRNPEASICTAEGVSQFRDIANFQDCHALPLFRKAIARFMEKARGGRARFDPDRIVMSGGDTGAQETMAFCLADPGEVFLIPNPYYPGFDQDFRWRTGVELMPFDCYSSNKFRITQSALETAYEEAVKNNKKVKGVLVANPSNPLGTTMDRETLRSLVSFVNDKKIHLVVDEIFSGTVFDSPRFVSVAEIVEDEPGRFNRDLIHVVYSVSKDLGLPGFRVGVIYSFNDAVVRCARRMSSFGLVSTQTQHLLAAMLGDEEFTSQFLAESRRRLPERRRAFEAGLRKVGVRSLDSNAGLFCWMDLRHLLKAKTVDEELKLWRMIVHEVKLNISPGASFHCAESGWFKSCRYEVAHLLEKIGHLETSKRNILGENLESHSLEELVELETKLENSLRSIRARKYQLLEQQLVQLQKEESHLMELNELLREQCKLHPELPFAISKEVPYDTATQQNEVETELCIGCPGRGNRTSAIPI